MSVVGSCKDLYNHMTPPPHDLIVTKDTKQSQSVLVSLVVSHHTTIQVSHNRYCPVTVDANENHSQLGSHIVDCAVTLQAGSVRDDAGPYTAYLKVTI